MIIRLKKPVKNVADARVEAAVLLYGLSRQIDAAKDDSINRIFSE